MSSSSSRVEVATGAEALSLIKSLIQQSKDNDDADQLGGEPAHTDPTCNCRKCRLSRYELPVAATGPDLISAIIEHAKAAHRGTGRNSTGAAEQSVELVFKPLSPEVERILMQYWVDRVNACVACEHALVALLPFDLRPPADQLSKPTSVEKALKVLAEGRAATVKKFEARRRQAETQNDVKEAIAQANAE